MVNDMVFFDLFTLESHPIDTKHYHVSSIIRDNVFYIFLVEITVIKSLD